MKLFFRTLSCPLLIVLLTLSGFPQSSVPKTRTEHNPIKLTASEPLDKVVASAVTQALHRFQGRGLKPSEVSATVIEFGADGSFNFGSYRGEERIYPASVVKMFYMVALERWLEDGRARWTKELERGERDMIVDSSNEATQYIVDVLTGTRSGTELPAKEFKTWSYKRNAMNRFFSSLGYTNINVNQKTHCEDAYGVEQQFRNYRGENRNMLTTNATARLMAEIALGRTNVAARNERMMTLLKRDAFRTDGKDEQATEFTGIALRERALSGAKLYSKAGWTSKSRHDVAYIELENGRKAVIAVFTENHANDKDIIPFIAGEMIDRVLLGLN